MKYPSNEQVARVRQTYAPGTRVCLPSGMDDPYSPIPAGTCGTVVFVDDMLNLITNWDNGSRLNAIYDVDSITIVGKR